MIEAHICSGVWIWFEEGALIGSLIVDMQFSLSAISRLQGLEVDALSIFFETPTFIIWPECSYGRVLNRLSYVIIRSQSESEGQAV